jgi:PII-like signaling protein
MSAPVNGSSFAVRPGVRLTLMMTYLNHTKHHSLEMEIIKRARKGHLAGLTVFQGSEGFGISGLVHRSHVLSDDAPLALVMVDTPERIDAFMESIADILNGVVAFRQHVEILDL